MDLNLKVSKKDWIKLNFSTAEDFKNAHFRSRQFIDSKQHGYSRAAREGVENIYFGRSEGEFLILLNEIIVLRDLGYLICLTLKSMGDFPYA